MIKHFCDNCEKEITPRPGRPSLQARIILGSARQATVTVSYSTAGKSEPLEICDHCLIDAVHSLDDRPQIKRPVGRREEPAPIPCKSLQGLQP